MTTYTLEREYKIYNDKSGARLRIGPDLDGLGLIEINGVNDYGRLVVPVEVAGYLAHAILHCIQDIQHFQAKVEEKLRPERIPDRDGWIEHDGKDIPVSPYCAVEIMMRDGTQFDDKIAEYWHSDKSEKSNWIHVGDSNDIVRYRVVP